MSRAATQLSVQNLKPQPLGTTWLKFIMGITVGSLGLFSCLAKRNITNPDDGAVTRLRLGGIPRFDMAHAEVLVTLHVLPQL